MLGMGAVLISTSVDKTASIKQPKLSRVPLHMAKKRKEIALLKLVVLS